MKKIKWIAMIFFCLCFAGINHALADGIAVSVDGGYIGFDVEPTMQNDRVLVPMRAIFEELGATVEWDGNTRTVTAKTADKTITMQIDSDKMYVNGQAVVLDQPAVISDGRTLVPVRAVSEATGANVSWDGANHTVNINSGNPISSSRACFYNGRIYYRFANEPAIYVWDGNTNYRYAAGGKPEGIIVYNDYIFYYCKEVGKSDVRIYRMSLDGKDRRILTSTDTSGYTGLVVKNNRIIYEEAQLEDDEFARIDSMNLDGSDKQILVEDKDYFAFNHGFYVSKNYIYYRWDGIIKRCSLKTGKREEMPFENYIKEVDKNGNIMLSGSDEGIYSINEATGEVIPYSSVAPAEEWYYYSSGGTIYRQRISDGVTETLEKGTFLGMNSETIVFAVTEYISADTMGSQQIYTMDVDGNNIRLVNEYSNGSVAQSNVGFDNSQNTNQSATCDVCHGQGYIECSICHGSGVVTKYTRVGTETKTCTHCGGRKQLSCIVCGGDGRIRD